MPLAHALSMLESNIDRAAGKRALLYMYGCIVCIHYTMYSLLKLVITIVT